MSNSFFATLPHNTSRLFVSAESKTECVIVVPVAFDEDLPRVRNRLHNILENQVINAQAPTAA